MFYIYVKCEPTICIYVCVCMYVCVCACVYVYMYVCRKIYKSIHYIIRYEKLSTCISFFSLY